jgi:hypothetical protein
MRLRQNLCRMRSLPRTQAKPLLSCGLRLRSTPIDARGRSGGYGGPYVLRNVGALSLYRAGRRTPNFAMRLSRVVGFIPRTSAAPPGPRTRQPTRFITSRM